MTDITPCFHYNGKPYQEMTDEQRTLIDGTIKTLSEEDVFIISTFESRAFNIIDSNPNYLLEFQSEFPHDLNGRIVKAYVNNKWPE